LGDLETVHRLLGGVAFVPPAVVRELGGIHLPDWLEIRSPQQPISTRILQASLGSGESEAIALALEMNAGLILLDDKTARHSAASLGLGVIGTLGLLLRAKQTGLIPAVRPKLDALASLPFHVSARLAEWVLKHAGESP